MNKSYFDVDNSMRVLDYNPNLWKSTLEMDTEKLTNHILATENQQAIINDVIEVKIGVYLYEA